MIARQGSRRLGSNLYSSTNKIRDGVCTMTLDSSLKQHGGLVRTRSVLTRAERIKQLGEEGKFDPNMNSPFGLVKVKVKHSKAGHKAKKAAEGEGEAGAEGAAAAVPAKGAA